MILRAREFSKLLAVSALLLLCSELQAANRIKIPDGVYYHRFASSISGPEAVWINPAGLWYYRTISFQLMGEFSAGKFAHSWGLDISGDGIGVGYRHLDDFRGANYDEYIFAAGSQFTYGLFLGGSYRYMKNGPEGYSRKHFWNIGLLVRQNPKYSFGAVFSNLNRKKIDGERTEIEQLYSLSYSPFNGLMTFSFEAALSTGQSLSGAGYVYGVDVFPMRGLMLHGSLDNEDRYELGFRINLARYFIGGQSRFGGGNERRGTTISAGVVMDSQSSILPFKSETNRWFPGRQE